jgi:hypothetical protein
MPGEEITSTPVRIGLWAGASTRSGQMPLPLEESRPYSTSLLSVNPLRNQPFGSLVACRPAGPK